MQPINIHLTIINAFPNPYVVFHLVQHSKNAGNKMPNVDNAKAPINEMNNSKFGMAMAKTTAMKKEEINIILKKVEKAG